MSALVQDCHELWHTKPSWYAMLRALVCLLAASALRVEIYDVTNFSQAMHVACSERTPSHWTFGARKCPSDVRLNFKPLQDSCILMFSAAFELAELQSVCWRFLTLVRHIGHLKVHAEFRTGPLPLATCSSCLQLQKLSQLWIWLFTDILASGPCLLQFVCFQVFVLPILRVAWYDILLFDTIWCNHPGLDRIEYIKNSRHI